MRIAIDLMGGKASPKSIIEKILQSDLARTEEFFFVLTRQESSFFPACKELIQRFRLAHLVESNTFITGDEPPLEAIRHKKDSSLIASLKLLKNQEVDGVLTTGSTGALVAAGEILLPKFPGIHRTALLALLPCLRDGQAEEFFALDVGAHVHSKAESLVQYAQMGRAYYQAIFGHKGKAGYLNIGEESQKGNSFSKQVYQLLEQTLGEDFVGNVEPQGAFQGKVEVLVCDGVSGNIFLKSAEGMAGMLLQEFTKVIGAEKGSCLEQSLQQDGYSGALLCGVDGLVLKCHGAASIEEVIRGIRKLKKLHEENILNQVRKESFFCKS